MKNKVNYAKIILRGVKMTIVFKISDNLKAKVIKYYEPLKREKTPPGNLSVLKHKNYANHYKMVIFLSNF